MPRGLHPVTLCKPRGEVEVPGDHFELSCSERFLMAILCPQRALGNGPHCKGAVWGVPDCVLRLLRSGLVGYKEDWQRWREAPPSAHVLALPFRTRGGEGVLQGN